MVSIVMNNKVMCLIGVFVFVDMFNFSGVVLSGYLYHFQILEYSMIDGQTHQGAHLVPSLQASSTRVDMQQSQARVTLNLQDVAVPADEERRRVGIDGVSYMSIVMSWIAADVSHQHAGALAGETYIGREDESQLATVGIAIHGSCGTELLQARDELHPSDVTCMPDLVA